MSTEDPTVTYLRSLPAVRDRCSLVYRQAESHALQYWTVDFSKLPSIVDFCAKLLTRDFGSDFASIPPHSRWRHFGARLDPVLKQWDADNVPVIDKARRLIDLFVVSVLLDAGAGDKWRYREDGGKGEPIGRSEGLAVASFDMWKAGLFSGLEGDKTRVDALGLSKLTVDAVKQAMQVDDEKNPMTGIEGRAQLLVRLRDVLASKENEAFFSGGPDDTAKRPGHLVGPFARAPLSHSKLTDVARKDYLLSHPTSSRIPSAAASPMSIQLAALWDVVVQGLGGVWPATRTKLHGVSLGDVWSCPVLESSPNVQTKGGEGSLVPFHKLSQWLTYSLIEMSVLPFLFHLVNVHADMAHEKLGKGPALARGWEGSHDRPPRISKRRSTSRRQLSHSR
jgi:hypothetical protein